MPLTITIPDREYFNEKTNEFLTIKGQTIQLEHSLISISKWESKWHKSYLDTEKKNSEELLDYIKCMTITNNVNSDVYMNLTQNNIDEIVKYIENPMTATTITDDKTKSTSKKQIVTSELIYSWMIAYQIPVVFEKWHLNRLIMLIKVLQIQNEPEDKKKMSPKEALRYQSKLNAERRAKHKSKINSAG